jgi:YD repeat-containing protein
MQTALQGNATGLSIGRYPWSITVTNSGTPTTYNGNVDIVNQANSPYGAGWSLDNVEQLVSVSGGVMIVNPDGTSLFFANNGSGGYTTPAGDFSTLTLSSGVYTRTMPDGTKINFNSSGQQTSSVDRDDNTTTFAYNGSGQLTTITDMNNQVTTLAYNASGLLSTITDAANRTATLTYTGSQLTSITDPANDVWQYAYDSANDLTALTDPNNNTTTFTYNTADRVSSVTRPDHTTDPASHLTVMQMNGWAGAAKTVRISVRQMTSRFTVAALIQRIRRKIAALGGQVRRHAFLVDAVRDQTNAAVVHQKWAAAVVRAAPVLNDHNTAGWL